MKPTLDGLIRLFRKNPGAWVNHAELVAWGGHRYGGRLHELKHEHRFGFEQQGQGERSRYCMTVDPGKAVYQALACACGWRGDELSALGWHCPRCGRPVDREDAVQVAQVALL